MCTEIDEKYTFSLDKIWSHVTCTCPESGNKMDPCVSCDHFFVLFRLV